jgi:hypothetical protein
MHLDQPRRLRAIEYRGRMRGGRTRPPLVAAIDGSGHQVLVVLKLLKPGTSIGNGHYGGTSLACELISAVIARSLGLSVPDYAFVEISRLFADAMVDREVRILFQSNIGLHFGSTYLEGFPNWDSSYKPPTTALIQELEDVLALDTAIVNGDRKTAKPNLLFRGTRLVMIDHSLALPVHRWSPRQIAASPLFPDAEIRAHCTYDGLSKKALSFSRLFDREVRSEGV